MIVKVYISISFYISVLDHPCIKDDAILYLDRYGNIYSVILTECNPFIYLIVRSFESERVQLRTVCEVDLTYFRAFSTNKGVIWKWSSAEYTDACG